MKYRTRRRKPLMCRIGLHKPSGDVCLTVRKCSSHRKGKHRWHRAKRLCVLCGKPLEGKQARYCAECAAVLSDPRSARMKNALPKTADGMKLTIENVVELCRHYRAPYSSYGQMMSYLTQYHAMPPKKYRR